mmetsp:Transcript_58468/g.156521  ORF Transcript_58468/g.156521 Transcript_58468/m.156521 type:complete len:355 (-) Transcript_58468:12-1076(-)
MPRGHSRSACTWRVPTYVPRSGRTEMFMHTLNVLNALGSRTKGFSEARATLAPRQSEPALSSRSTVRNSLLKLPTRMTFMGMGMWPSFFTRRITHWMGNSLMSASPEKSYCVLSVSSRVSSETCSCNFSLASLLAFFRYKTATRAESMISGYSVPMISPQAGTALKAQAAMRCLLRDEVFAAYPLLSEIFGKLTSTICIPEEQLDPANIFWSTSVKFAPLWYPLSATSLMVIGGIGCQLHCTSWVADMPRRHLGGEANTSCETLSLKRVLRASSVIAKMLPALSTITAYELCVRFKVAIMFWAIRDMFTSRDSVPIAMPWSSTTTFDATAMKCLAFEERQYGTTLGALPADKVG